VKAVLKLPKQVQLAIVGGPHSEAGKDRFSEKLLNLIEKRGLRDRIRITEYTSPETIRLYSAAADICLAPHRDINQSGSASLGLALNSGRPVIASRIPPFIEINERADCMLMFAEGAMNEMAWQIQRLIADPQLQRELVRRAECYAKENRWEKVAERTIGIYEELVSAGHAARKVTSRSFQSNSGFPQAKGGGAISSRQVATTASPVWDGVLRNVKVQENLYVTFVLDPKLDDPIARAIAEKSEFPWRHTYAVMLQFLQRCHTLLDVGAHIGTYSLLAAALGCRVIAVEGCPNNVHWLRATAEHNRFEGLSVHHAAASNESGEADFFPDRAWGYVQAAKQGRNPSSISVPAVAIDELLAELGCARVDFVKIDIEGSEIRAIQGMQKLLGRPDGPVLLFESNAVQLEKYGQTTHQLLEAVSLHGYDIYLVDHAREGYLVPVGPADLQPEAVSDYLACKRDKAYHLSSWQVDSPFSREVLVERLLRTCVNPYPPFRRHAALTLKHGPSWLTSEPAIRDMLRILRDDLSSDVRAAAEWSAKLGYSRAA
jgi:FkbM family methyltransferase